MKGFVNILELISVIIAVVVAMNVFFPGFIYRNNWNQANLLLSARDLILTIDRTGNLYRYSFDSDSLRQFFLNITPSTNIISWSEVEGTFKQKLIIACNCTPAMKSKLDSIFGPQNQFRVNGRSVDVPPSCLIADLNTLNSCYDIQNPKHTADVLVIWGYNNLSPNLISLNQFLNGGSGIVEIADFNQSNWIDSAQNSLFGIQPGIQNSLTPSFDYFTRKPDNSSDIIYGPYKYFYHVPFPEYAGTTPQTIPTEGSISACSGSGYPGSFTLNTTPYKFWICNSSAVYFDTDNNSTADTIVSAGQNFSINATNYILSYIDFPTRIGIRFNPSFNISDFFAYPATPPPPVAVNTSDGRGSRILVNASVSGGQSLPVVILNNSNSRTVWMADTSYSTYSDDQRQLLLSLILWASNKKTVAVLAPNLQVGYLTSYINVNDTDMFEVYRLGLGLGYAY